jgi:hypothetical protein
MTADMLSLCIAKLESLCNEAYDVSNQHFQKGFKDCLGYDYFGRCVSCFMGVKTFLFALEYSGTHEDFDDQYINTVLPSHFPVKRLDIAQKYMKEAHTASRFILFQNFYSQTEFTYRVILREKQAKITNFNPFRLMVEKYGILDHDFVKFVNAIRNTIHNNGYYFPTDITQRVEYDFCGTKFLFEYGRPLREISMNVIFEIISHILKDNIKLFEIQELAEIKFG